MYREMLALTGHSHTKGTPASLTGQTSPSHDGGRERGCHTPHNYQAGRVWAVQQQTQDYTETTFTGKRLLHKNCFSTDVAGAGWGCLLCEDLWKVSQWKV